LGAVPARACTVTDAGTGVAGNICKISLTGATSAGVGSLTLVATATDRAGNTGRKAIKYRVVYKGGGLVAPSAGAKPKVFRKGSTVIVRLKLANVSGAAVTPAKAPVWVKPKVKGKSEGAPNQPMSTVKPDKGSVFVKRGKFWEFRWGTAKAKKGKAYVLKVRLDDGTTRTVTIGIG